MSRRFSILQKLAAVAPLLLLGVYLPGQTMLRCQFDGLLRPACCCPVKAEAPSSGPAIEARDCCDREVTPDVRAPVANRASDRELVSVGAVVFAAAPVAFVVPPSAQPDRASQRHGPAREGPPLVLLKHAFLI
jgi:hypothetical protein